MTFLAEMDGATGFISPELDRNKGADLHSLYAGASPFPHIVIDDFLPPSVLEMCLREFPSQPAKTDVTFNTDMERLKTQYNPDLFTDKTRTLFYSFNSKPFIRVLENVTGIKGLVPDPYFLGAGFHEVRQGGHLSIHADFNHHKPMDLERRINVLIYLNKDWQSQYGGSLELWSRDMASCVEKITPIFNRCVIFNTTDDSFHGNPQPVEHPSGVSRKSIALYFYTATWTPVIPEHTTQFQLRPGDQKKADWRAGARGIVADVLPPIVSRGLRSLKKKTLG